MVFVIILFRNFRESKKRRSKSIDTTDKLLEKMSKIVGEDSSGEINLQENRESLMAFDSLKHQSESNHLEPTVSSTTVLLPECAQSNIEIDSKIQEPQIELPIIPSAVPKLSAIIEPVKLQVEPPISVSSEVSSTFDQSTLPQVPKSVYVSKPNKLIADTLVEVSPNIKQTDRLTQPKTLKLKVSANKIPKKILPKPVPSNKADPEIESSVRAVDLAVAIIRDPRLLKPEYCKRKSEDEDLTVITAFSASTERTPPVDITSFSDTFDLNSEISLFPIPPKRSPAASADPSISEQQRDMKKCSMTYPMEESDISVLASGSDTNLFQDKINNRIRTRGKSICVDRFPHNEPQDNPDSITISLAELQECAVSSRRITKRSLSMYKELPQSNKKDNYSENMSLIKSIIEDSNITKFKSTSAQGSLKEKPDIKRSASSKEKATIKPNEFRPIKTLGRIPKMVRPPSNELKHETTTRNKTKTVKKDTTVYSKRHGTKTKLDVENTNEETKKIPQTNTDHVKVPKTPKVSDDPAESVQERNAHNQDVVSPILFELLSLETSFKHNSDVRGDQSLNKIEPKLGHVTDSCSLTDQPNTVDKNLEEKSVNSERLSSSEIESNQMPKAPTLDIETNESIFVGSTDAKNGHIELPIDPQSSEIINEKIVTPETMAQPLQEITNGYVVATHDEPVIQISRRVSKHRSRKSSEHSKVSRTTLPADTTSSSNSNMDIDTELERMHGMVSETSSPYTSVNLLTPCVDNASLIVAVEQKLKDSTSECDYQANGNVNVPLEPKRVAVLPNEHAKAAPTTKTAAEKTYSELTAPTENSDHAIETPKEDSAERRQLIMEILEHDELGKLNDLVITTQFTTPADISMSDKGNESILKSNDVSMTSETSPLHANRVYKTAGRVMYYVEQAQDGSNEETMYIVRKKKKKSKKIC